MDSIIAVYKKRLNDFLTSLQRLKEDIKYIEIIRKFPHISIDDDAHQEGSVRAGCKSSIHPSLELRSQNGSM